MELVLGNIQKMLQTYLDNCILSEIIYCEKTINLYSYKRTRITTSRVKVTRSPRVSNDVYQSFSILEYSSIRNAGVLLQSTFSFECEILSL